jgi:ubiquitin-conjugating enzyme E2 Z
VGKKPSEYAEAYIRKIYHETLHISVIKRLEGCLKIDPGTKQDESDDDDEVDEGETAVDSEVAEEEETSPEEEDDLSDPPWADECKRLFLCYYDHYLVSLLTRNLTIRP